MHIIILCIQHDLILCGVFTLYAATITIILRCITISGVKAIIFFLNIAHLSLDACAITLYCDLSIKMASHADSCREASRKPLVLTFQF